MRLLEFLSEDSSSQIARNYTMALNAKYEPYQIPVKITSHFIDRMRDPRNAEEITASEIADFFAKLLLKKKDFLQTLPDEISFQVTDLNTDITVAFKKNNGVLFAITLIRGDLLRGNQRRIAI